MFEIEENKQEILRIPENDSESVKVPKPKKKQPKQGTLKDT